MDIKEIFAKALEQGDSCVIRVKDSDLKNDTPCTEWNLKQLINHMVYELSWAPDLIAGKTIKEVGDKYEGDLLGEDYQAAWKDAAKKASEVVENANLDNLAHLSYGDVPNSNYIHDLARDMLIHGWDVGQSLNFNLKFDERIAEEIYERDQPMRKEFAASGMFGTEVKVEDNAPIQVKLLGLYGRRSPTS